MRKQVARAASWSDSCLDMIEAAEYQLKLALSGGDGSRIAQARIALQGVKRTYNSAVEDANGWRRLSPRASRRLTSSTVQRRSWWA